MEKEQAIEVLKAAGFTVRSTDEEAKFLSNFKESEVEKEIGNRIGQVHQHYDDDIAEITGLRKESGQKTYDFNKQILRDLKTAALKVPQLEKQLKDGTADESTKTKLTEYQKEVDQLKTAYQKEKEAWEAEKQNNVKALHQYKIESQLDHALQSLQFKDDAIIPKAAKEALIRERKSALLKMADFSDEKLVFKSDKGEVLRNKDNALEPMTAAEILHSELKDIIEEKRTIPGVGADGKPDKSKQGTVTLSVPSTVRSQKQLTDFLLQSGLVRGSKEYVEAFNAHGKELPLVV
jgi:hypothetical protein